MAERAAAVYRIELSRHRERSCGTTEHYTLVRIKRNNREICRTHSHLYDSLAESVAQARVSARAEARFLRSLARVGTELTELRAQLARPGLHPADQAELGRRIERLEACRAG